MRIKIKPQNIKRLASLSALGAGALAVGVPNAEAGIIYTAANSTIGFAGGSNSSVNFTLPGLVDFNIHRGSSTVLGTHHVAIAQVGGTAVYFHARNVSGNVLQAFPANATWGTAPGFLIDVIGKGTGSFTATLFNATNKYFLFDFKDTTAGNALRYGWGELAVSFTSFKPDVTLVGYAYDDTGAKIAAGSTGAAAPEPSGLALMGLGALVLGGRGIRRWKTSKQS